MASGLITSFLGEGLAASRPADPDVGNAIAFWWSTDTNEMSAWLENAWVEDVFGTGGALLVANNLSDLANAATARTNLGLGLLATLSNLDLNDLGDVDTTGVADGDVLAYDSGTGDWLPAAPGGGGGLVFIGSYAPSAVASLDIENFAGLSGYSRIVIDYGLAVSTDSTQLTLQAKLNGAYKSGASDYKYTSNLMFSATTGSTAGSTGGSSIGLTIVGAGGIGSNSVEGVDGRITLVNPYGTSRWHRCLYETTWVDDQAAQRIVRMDGSGVYAGTTSGDATGFALGGVRLAVSAGTMTGNVYVYGVVDS